MNIKIKKLINSGLIFLLDNNDYIFMIQFTEQ